VRNASVPDTLCPLAGGKVLVRNSRELLLILPGKIGDIAHSNGQKRPGCDGAEGERRHSAEEDTAVA